MPVPCCDDARIRRPKLFPLDETGGVFRGYRSSERRFFYGLKLHAVVDEHRQPVEVRLMADRKANSTRPRPAWGTYVLRVYRKAVETAFGEIEKLLPGSIHAVTGRGFELKVYLFVLAYSLSGLC